MESLDKNRSEILVEKGKKLEKEKETMNEKRIDFVGIEENSSEVFENFDDDEFRYELDDKELKRKMEKRLHQVKTFSNFTKLWKKL